MSALFGREFDVVNNCMRSASEVNQMADVAFFSRYGEGSRAVGFYSEPAGTVAERIFDYGAVRAIDPATALPVSRASRTAGTKR